MPQAPYLPLLPPLTSRTEEIGPLSEKPYLMSSSWCEAVIVTCSPLNHRSNPLHHNVPPPIPLITVVAVVNANVEKFSLPARDLSVKLNSKISLVNFTMLFLSIEKMSNSVTL